MTDLDQPVFSALDWLALQRGQLPAEPPRAALLLHQSGLLEGPLRRHRASEVGGLGARVRVLRRGRLAVAGGFGPGSPATAALAEQLSAWGVRSLVSLGLAGGLQTELRPGDVVVCTRAWRGEGTSGHYLPPGPWAEAAPDLVERIGRALRGAGCSCRAGASWTTDAPFRELRREVIRHQGAGLLTVEMEAAALLAVGQALQVPVAAVFVVADSLAGGRWAWAGDQAAPRQTMETVCAALIELLAGDSMP